jgi:hypothetical protein
VDDLRDRPPHWPGRKTIRAYLNGTRTPGVRTKPAVDAFEMFIA